MDSNIRFIIGQLERRRLWNNGNCVEERRSNVKLREIVEEADSVKYSKDVITNDGVENINESISGDCEEYCDEHNEHSTDEYETESDSCVYEDNYKPVAINGAAIDTFELNVLDIISRHKWTTVYGYRVDLILSAVISVIAYCFRCLGTCAHNLIPSVTPVNLAVVSVATSAAVPAMISNHIIYPSCRLLFGTLYPAYASYKAVRTKNVKEYVKWMMYWIVFALFTCAETFTDVFFSWFPFYYEVKILMVIWLLSPATKGSSILYRKFVHPALCRREQEIDEYISKAKDQGYHTVLNLGTKGVNYATNVIMQTAIKGGGGLVQQLRKSYSLSDLSMSDDRSDRSQQELDEVDDVVSMGDHRVVRRSVQGRTSRDVRGPRTMSAPRMDMIFAEVDVDRHSTRNSNSRDSMNLSHIRSSEDISGPYPPEKSNSQDALTRTASVGGASTRTRSKVVRSTFTSIKRPGAAEDEEVLIEELEDDLSLPAMGQNIPSSLLSDGTLCLPNSNDMLIHYLRNLMEKDLQQRNNSDVKDRTDDDYENYLKLKEKFEVESKSDKIIAESSKAEVQTEKNDGVVTKDDTPDKRPIADGKVSAAKGKDFVDDIDGVKSLPNVDTKIVHSKDVFKSNSEVCSNVVPEIKEDVVAIVKDEAKLDVSRKLSDLSSSSVQIDQVLKLGDSLVPNFSIVRNTQSTEEITSIGASSSALSSDDELSEFATPSSSPKLKTKVKKMAKHKKRHAPPPPQIKLDISSENTKEDFKPTTLKNLEITQPEQPSNKAEVMTKTSQSIQTKDADILKEKVAEGDEAKKTAHASTKSGFKGVSSLSKLIHLPTKLSFWGSSEEPKKGHSDSKNKQPNKDESTKNTDSAAYSSCSLASKSVDQTEEVAQKMNLDSDEESFQDAHDVEESIKTDTTDNNSGKNIWNDNVKPESVPLKVDDTKSEVEGAAKTKVECATKTVVDATPKTDDGSNRIKDDAAAKTVNEGATKSKDDPAAKTVVENTTKTKDAAAAKTVNDGATKTNEDLKKTQAESVIKTNIDNKDYTYIPLRIATISVNTESTSTDV